MKHLITENETFSESVGQFLFLDCKSNDEKITIALIKRKFGLTNSQENLEILDKFYKVSLICPLTKVKLKIPARSNDCEHLECFDLKAFLTLFHKSLCWT